MKQMLSHKYCRVVLQILGIILLTFTLTSQSAVSQTKFKKYSGNPVLTAGPAGSWDEAVDGIFGCSVLYHNSKYHMWFGGYKGSVGTMGYAYSDDGITWTKYSGNPVFTPGAAGDFDAVIGGCSVIFYSGKFHMWYNGSNSGTTKIGYAYSDDGIHWTKHPTYVFEKGIAGAWDEKSVSVASVVKEDSVLKMFYWGKSATSSWFTGLATSPDSIHWARQNSGNSVLSGGLAEAWDQYSQAVGTVLKHDGIYEMWYDNETPSPYCIGYASSTNGGLNWNTYSGNPILYGYAGTWDAGFTIYPMAVRRPDGRYLLYYTGVNDAWTTQSIGLAIEDTESVVASMGSKFSEFYNRTLTASSLQKSAIVDSFFTANPTMPFIEDSIVHFIYRGTANKVTVPSDANAMTNFAWSMESIPGTDLWYLPKVFERDARIDYAFVINGSSSLILDPKNPRKVAGGYGEKSELAMPNYIDPPEIKYYAGIPHGTLNDSTVLSLSLGNTRTIRIYTPPGYNPTASDSYAVALFQDGPEWLNFCNAANILDYLIDKKRIPPIIGVFVPPVDRNAEYGGAQKEQYSTFIANVLMQYIDARYKTKKNPVSRAVIGYSMGSQISLQIGYNYPSVFGNVGAFSGASSGNLLAYNGEKRPLKLYIDVGTYEHPISGGWDFLNDVRTFHKTANIMMYDHIYNEWHEGHSCGNWRAHLDNALEYFFPGIALEVVQQKQEIPTSFALMQNYPNPFNPTTTIRYALSSIANVKLSVYDLLGREIATLVNEEQSAGWKEVKWNAMNVSSGIYFYKLQAGNFVETKKMLVVK